MIACKRLALLMLPMALLLLAAPALATTGGAGGCGNCHPGFGGFGQPLHDAHLAALTQPVNCGLCHTTPGDNPDLNESSDGVSCTGCHDPSGTLEYHTMQAGQDCTPCHQPGSWPAPPPEGTLPPYYGRADVLLDSACENEGLGHEADTTGLDNDGDGLRDADDPDCDSVPVDFRNWGVIKQIFNDY